MTQMLQKAVTPAVSAAYLDKGFDRVAGFVVPAAEVASVTTTAQLMELHGLAYPGSPFRPDRPIDVLHTPQPATARLLRATGGSTPDQREATGGPFLEPEPFTGTGLAETDGVVVTLSWLEHTRLEPGSRLWRFHPERSEPELVGTYHGPAFGWEDHRDDAGTLHAVAPSTFVGPSARTDDGVFAAQLETAEDGKIVTVTLVSGSAIVADKGFTATESGTWAKRVPVGQVDAVFELHVAATWRGMPVRVVERFRAEDDGADQARVFALGLNAAAAARLRMGRVEPGVYESTVPFTELEKPETTQRFAPAWPGRDQAAARAAAAREGGGADTTKAVQQELSRRIARGVAEALPGARRIQILARVVTGRVEIAAQGTLADGTTVPLSTVPEEVVRSITALRHVTARPDGGAWFSLAGTLDDKGRFALRFDYDDEPSWQTAPTPDAYAKDLERYPRAEGKRPAWLVERLEEAGGAPGGDAPASPS